ncbi:Hypothetical protein, predicted transmembrane protein, DUF285 family [Mycoplasma yeatsii 13926]|uniref:PARCEL domain-containing protein n=1 Tax=Mycoplasma yeatsii 13926 TaxID=1188240 RepID=S6G8Y2_9MOLU|nr:BspA family leucine-rich repeat surface protein [Mycoplasma yeatsii]EOA07370.1 Hypothetical protein, predicted transmembrane protein, DUF285 family [Mycoplasma yeatsii 13926]
MKKVESKKKSKSKILLVIAGLLVVFSSITGVTIGLLHSKKEQNKDFIDLSRDISENERFLDILYIENKEEILKHINKILIAKKPNIDIKLEHVTMVFNKNSASVTVVANNAGDVKGEVEMKFYKPDIASLVKNENKDLGLFIVANQQNIIDEIIRRNILQNNKFDQNFNFEKFNKDFDININQQSRTIVVKAKSDSTHYTGEIEFKYQVPFSSLDQVITTVDRLENNSNDTILNRFLELNRNLFNQENVIITKDQLKVEVNTNTAKIILTGNKNYQGEIQVNLEFKTDISNLELNTNAGVFDSADKNIIIDSFISNNREKLQGLTTQDFELVGDIQDTSLTVKVKNNNSRFKGQVVITFSIKDDFNKIKDIVKEINNLNNNDQETVLNRFVELNSDILNSHKITREQLTVSVRDNIGTITVINHPNYQGSIQVNLKSSLKVAKSYLGVLDSDDQQSILRTLNNQNNWSFSLNDLNIEVNGKDVIITGKENKNKKFIGTINVEFGLKASYTTDDKELKRIGFFKNESGKWQIERVRSSVNKIPPNLPRFITSLQKAFSDNNNMTISGLENWDTSNVTDMSQMFRGALYFNQPLGDKFDTSKVINMNSMFERARSFNQPLGDKFDTSNVTNMNSMFSSATYFNQSLGDKFDTSNVTDMSQMFSRASDFNQPLGDKFDTSNVTNMSSMFSEASNFNQPLGDKFDTSNVTDMSQMFQKTSFNQPLGDKFDTSNVTDMSSMFSKASNFNQPLGDKFDTSNVTRMTAMFQGAWSFNQPIGNWDVSKVTDMSFMFNGASNFNQDISNWNITITDLEFLFYFMDGSKINSLRDKLPEVIRKLLN